MCTSTAQARRIWLSAAGASNDSAPVVAPCAFSHMVMTFVAGARETSCFGDPKSTFRENEMQFSWQVHAAACSTLDMVVIVEELRFRDRCSES